MVRRVPGVVSGLVALLVVAVSPVAAQRGPDAPVLPRDQVQALVRSALQNPADTAAFARLEAALPVARDAGTAGWTATVAGWMDGVGRTAAAALEGGVRRLGSGFAGAATTPILALTLAAAVLLLVLIRREPARKGERPGASPLSDARALARAGTPAERVVQETGVSRDVVEMMVRLGRTPAAPAPRAPATAPAPASPARPSSMRSPAAPPRPAPAPHRGDLRHLAGGAAAYTALAPRAAAATGRPAPAPSPPPRTIGSAPRPAAPPPPPPASEHGRSTLRFTYADLPEPGDAPDPRGGGRIDPSTRLGGMIGDLFTPASDPTRERR